MLSTQGNTVIYFVMTLKKRKENYFLQQRLSGTNGLLFKVLTDLNVGVFKQKMWHS